MRVLFRHSACPFCWCIWRMLVLIIIPCFLNLSCWWESSFSGPGILQFCQIAQSIYYGFIQWKCYAACPWASARPPFLFPYPIPALLFYSYLRSPSGSTFLGLLDHRVIPMPHLCLVYYYLLFFLSPPSLTHPILCTLLTLSPMSYSSSSYSSLLLTDQPFSLATID